MKLGERLVICLGRDKAILKHQTHKGKLWLVPKDQEYGVMISAFQSQDFGFGHILTVPDIQTINKYITLQHKYVDTYAAKTIMGHTHKETITMGINPF